MSVALRLLWFDGLAGGGVGLLVVALHRWLAGWYGLSAELVLGVGVVNVLYGTYSSSLALRATRGSPPPPLAVRALVAGNLGWTVVCAILVATHLQRESALGLVVLAGEGLFVGALGLVEARTFPGVLRPPGPW
jgi:hypothetical protein